MDEASPTLAGLVPTAVQRTARVIEQVEMARDTFRLRLECPELAKRILPGQFFMVREPGLTDPLLGRPFALFDVAYDSDGEPVGIDFGYIVVGKLTRRMVQWKPGDLVSVWGPLGNGFPEPCDGHLVMVAGGIGQTPFLAVTREALGQRQYGDPPRTAASRPELTLCYGARSASQLAGIDSFPAEGLDLRVATDDGSHGHHGFVTDLLQDLITNESAPTMIYTCGPEPMMEAVAMLAAEHDIACRVSLETPMACGFGACFSCVTRVLLDNGQWDYRRTCVEGPIFPAEKLQWPAR
ncbi:MAG: dihydroorotate dehydrogenase electron transfer subunit [Planctomycetaceae bacterium]